MSEIKWGLISKIDADCLMKTIDLIAENNSGSIHITELGCYAGETGNAFREYVKSKGRDIFLIGVENNRDGEKMRFEYDRLIVGNSNEVYNQIADRSQDLVVVDANHSFPWVISDWYCYSRKVKVGGFIALHDTAPQAQGTGWQNMGSEDDKDMYIAVKEAMDAIGLTWGELPDWEIVFEDFDPNDAAGGFTILQKK